MVVNDTRVQKKRTKRSHNKIMFENQKFGRNGNYIPHEVISSYKFVLWYRNHHA